MARGQKYGTALTASVQVARRVRTLRRFSRQAFSPGKQSFAYLRILFANYAVRCLWHKLAIFLQVQVHIIIPVRHYIISYVHLPCFVNDVFVVRTHGVRYGGEGAGGLGSPVFRENQWIFKIYNRFLIILRLWPLPPPVLNPWLTPCMHINVMGKSLGLGLGGPGIKPGPWRSTNS